MKCPVCKNKYLKATKLEDGLPAYGCSSCNGAQVSLLYYRDWAERAKGAIPLPLDAPETEDSASALQCPKCGKIMEKLAIKGDISNKLDFCLNCDEAWLDKGEWELLQSLSLSDKITSIITTPWQNRVTKERSALKADDRFSKVIGEPDFTKAKAFRDWLNDHPKRAEIVFYLSQKEQP